MSFAELILTILSAAYLVDVILNSTILVHLTNAVARTKLYTRDDLRNWLMQKAPAWVFDLLHCPLCLSFHTSWALLLLSIRAGMTGQEFVLNVLACAWATDTLYKRSHGAPVTTVQEPEPEPAEVPQAVQEQDFMGVRYKGTPNELGQIIWSREDADPNKDELLKFFDSNDFCSDPYCFGLKSAYEEELASLHMRAAKDSKVCSPCAINSLKNKYYNKLKLHFSASADSKVS
jgi:hypothetical protein